MEKKTILFVDDEQAMLNTYKRAFFKEPYELLVAQDGQQALGIMKEHDVHILATDMQMPGMSGLELIEVAMKKFPQAVRILVSGQPCLDPQDVSNMVQALHRGDIFKFVAKSADVVDEVKQAVQEAAEHVDDTSMPKASVV